MALHRGKVKNPSQATDRSRRQSLTPLNDPPITGPSRCQQTPRVTRSRPAQSFHLVPQDDATQCNALEAHQSHSNDEVSVQVSGLCLLSSQRVCTSVRGAKRVAKAGYTLYLWPHKQIEPLYPLELSARGHRTRRCATAPGVAMPQQSLSNS